MRLLRSKEHEHGGLLERKPQQSAYPPGVAGWFEQAGRTGSQRSRCVVPLKPSKLEAELPPVGDGAPTASLLGSGVGRRFRFLAALKCRRVPLAARSVGGLPPFHLGLPRGGDLDVVRAIAHGVVPQAPVMVS